jgi:hypothetical protein
MVELTQDILIVTRTRRLPPYDLCVLTYLPAIVGCANSGGPPAQRECVGRGDSVFLGPERAPRGIRVRAKAPRTSGSVVNGEPPSSKTTITGLPVEGDTSHPVGRLLGILADQKLMTVL